MLNGRTNMMWATDDTDSLNRTTINLKVLGALRPGERLSMQDACFVVQPYRWFQPLMRWWAADNRWRTLEAVTRVIGDAVRIMTAYALRHQRQQQQQQQESVGADVPTDAAAAAPRPGSLVSAATVVSAVAQELERATQGLDNLRETYLDDKTFVAHVDVLREKIDGEVRQARSIVATGGGGAEVMATVDEDTEGASDDY